MRVAAQCEPNNIATIFIIYFTQLLNILYLNYSSCFGFVFVNQNNGLNNNIIKYVRIKKVIARLRVIRAVLLYNSRVFGRLDVVLLLQITLRANRVAAVVI